MMQFFVWLDESPKTSVGDKIQGAIAAYVERFKKRPTLVLVNAIDSLEMQEVTVRTSLMVQPNTFWVGHDVLSER
jgi:hypothetical protein